MNVAELQTDLIQLILETKSPSSLQKVIQFVNEMRKKEDWWDDLSEKQQQLILKSAQQADEGKLIPHHVVRAEISQLLKKHKS